MGTMQQALQDVGYRPTGLRARLLNSAKQKKETPRPTPITIEALVDGVIDPITKQLKIQVQRAGSHYRARYQGGAVSVFGETAKDATHNLKFFSKDGR